MILTPGHVIERLGLSGRLARMPDSTPVDHGKLRTCYLTKDDLHQAQIGDDRAADFIQPETGKSAKKPALQQVRLWSWQKTDDSDGQSQHWKVTAELTHSLTHSLSL